MRAVMAYLGLVAVVGLLPIWAKPADESVSQANFPGWPTRFTNTTKQQLPLAPHEQRFAQGFPGKIAKFKDAKQRYIVRFVARPTRRLHPALDCFRASGYRVTPQARCPTSANANGCFIAERDEQRLLVHERISDATGQAFGDVSAWYWATLRSQTRGPWWSVTTIAAAPAE